MEIRVTGAVREYESDTVIYYRTQEDNVKVEAKSSLPISIMTISKSRWDFEKGEEVEKSTYMAIATPWASIDVDTQPIGNQKMSETELVFNDGLLVSLDRSKKIRIDRDF